MTQRIEPFFNCDSNTWTSFWIWFEELNFCQIFSTQSQRIEPPFFFNTTQRIEHLFFLHVTHVFIWFKELIFFFWKISQRIDFSYDSKNGTWRRDLKFMFFKIWFKELDFFYDSQTWSFFFKNYDAKNFLKNMTERIEPFFVWLKELNFFFWFAAKNWVFFLLNFDSKNWAIFLNSTQRIELFLYDLQNWTSSFLLIWFKELNLVSKKATQKIEIFFFKKMTHRIELFVNDS